MPAGEDPFAVADLGTVSSDDFARMVRSTSRERLDELLSDVTVRTKVLDEVFGRMGTRYRGDAGTTGVVHWRIQGRSDGTEDVYETVLGDGRCAVNRDTTTNPTVTISLRAPEFLLLASGNGSPTTMFFSGKLKVAGDIGFAASAARMFDIPQG